MPGSVEKLLSTTCWGILGCTGNFGCMSPTQRIGVAQQACRIRATVVKRQILPDCIPDSRVASRQMDKCWTKATCHGNKAFDESTPSLGLQSRSVKFRPDRGDIEWSRTIGTVAHSIASFSQGPRHPGLLERGQ